MPRFAFALAALVACASPSFAEEKAPSFDTDVMPLFTKAGCNQGACHGKGTGQNGFRLSLRGFAPDQDYKWITRGLVADIVTTSIRGLDLKYPEVTAEQKKLLVNAKAQLMAE